MDNRPKHYAIYKNPSDFKGKYFLRRWICDVKPIPDRIPIYFGSMGVARRSMNYEEKLYQARILSDYALDALCPEFPRTNGETDQSYRERLMVHLKGLMTKPLIMYRADSEEWRVIQVECRDGLHPANDADGKTIFTNTHFKSSKEAWKKLYSEAKAFLSLSLSSQKRLKSELSEASDRVIEAATALDTVIEKMPKENDYGIVPFVEKGPVSIPTKMIDKDSFNDES